MSLIATLLGENNPVTQWTGRNSNLLTGLGTSLLSDGMNFQPAQVGATLDRQVAAQKDADAKLAASTQAGSAALRKQGFIDLADAVDANALPLSDAWNEGFKRMQPGYGQTGGNEYQERFDAGQNFGLSGNELNNFALTGKMPTPTEPPYRPMTVEEKVAAGIPPDMPAQIGPDGKIDPIGGGGQTINVSTGGGTDDFYKKLDTDAGAQQAALLDAGRNAASNNMRLGKLDALLANAPQGAAGVFTQAAGSVGIPMQGLDDLQAAQALISQMVPGQRPPGSGTMSDADLALFKQSLPAIINQPGGNQKIIATARAINEYTIQQAAIAEKVASREITPAEGRTLQASIPNPLAFGAGADKPAGAPMAISSDAEYDALPSGAEFIDPEGNRRRKP